MKFPVQETTTKEVEIQFPLCGDWDGEVDDGRVSWETRFFINEELELRTVTRYFSGRERWEMSLEKLGADQVGHYLKYHRVTEDAFWDWANQAKARFTR